MDEYKLRLSEPNGTQEDGSILRIHGWQAIDVMAPEYGGSWGIEAVVPPELAMRPQGVYPIVGISQGSGVAHIRTPRDFVGEGAVEITWQPHPDSGQSDPIRGLSIWIHFADGPQTQPEPMVAQDVTVVFAPKIDGKRYDAKIVYSQVPYLTVKAIDQHFPVFLGGMRSCLLTPDQFEDEFGLKGLARTEVRPLAEKKAWNQ